MKNSFIRELLLICIRFYQNFFSPNHSWIKHHYPWGFCRFYPSCSQYAYDSIKRYGVNQGVWRAIKRLSKCHPWHPGGFDLVK